MTRPMPGPPQWYESASLGDWDDDGRWCNRWNLYHADGRAEYDVPERHDKHITDEGAAAHYWQAKSALGAIEAVLVSPALIKSRIRTWQRFKDTPHALEATP